MQPLLQKDINNLLRWGLSQQELDEYELLLSERMNDSPLIVKTLELENKEVRRKERLHFLSNKINQLKQIQNSQQQ